MLKGLFGGPPKKTAEEMAKEWKQQFRVESRNIDKQIRKIQREEAKCKIEAKKAAKANEPGAVRILAKEILHARKTTQRLRTTQTMLSSCAMQVQQQLQQLKVMGGLQRSNEIMSTMNNLVRVPELSATMRAMSQEMTKAGMLDEMLGEAMDDVLDDDVDDDELDEEVGKVVEEVMAAKMKGARVGSAALPEADAESEAEEEQEAADEEEDEDLMARYKALQSAAS
jgi:charged multivesicular body protein 3